MKKNGLKHTAAQGLTIILALMLMLALMPVMGEKTMAEDEMSFMSDNCKYTVIDTSDHSVRLDSYRGDDRDLIVPETVEHEGITYTVVKIGAMDWQTSPLVRMELPDTVTELSVDAFSGLKSLQAISLSKSITEIPDNCFFGCSALKTVRGTSQVTSIGHYAFYNCGLTSFTVPENVTKLGESVFSYSSKLKTVTLSRKMKSVDPSAFEFSGVQTFKVQRGSKYFAAGKYLLYNKKKTRIVAYAPGRKNRSYTVPGNVTSIGAHAFYLNTHLRKVTIRKNVRTIGTGAFECSDLTSVILAGRTRVIGENAFQCCDKLKSVSFGKRVHTIQAGAFRATNLKSVRIPRNVKKIGKQAFGYDWDVGFDEENTTIDIVVKRSGFKIYGKKGSSAHKYAKANKFKFVKY
ncbi:hypothetical protein BHK98_07545 [Hornefia porci]|uniref:Leucine-rich repeat domain-containing protein n=1 Tax=Hornefia porci TaxID=2652292 RepID=A0A1Q9JID3_9FIRM|nr:leucine-rich repeat domain-containing protein [Hornefia porci]OLR55925.1 hypothetical protein BHK98_07545 [Hornefia porci]